MTWFGWDASNHDWGRGPMDIAAAVRDGISFFTHKATEGGTYQDPYLKQAMDRARATSLTWYGTYFVPRTPGKSTSLLAQVDHYLAYLDSQIPWWRTDPRFRVHQVDTEKWGYDNVSAEVGAAACVLLAQRGGGKHVVHYAPAWAYGNSIGGQEWLWASAYGTNPVVPWRLAYPGDAKWPAAYSGRTAAVWQFGSRVSIGTQNTCDINAIKDPLVWAALTGGDDMTPQQEQLLRDTYYWARAACTGRDATPQGNIVRDTWDGMPVGGTRQLAGIAADVAAVRAADTAQTAAITALVDVINKLATGTAAGGSINAAPILAAIEGVKTSVHAEVRAQFARIAAAAQAEAAALTPDAQ